MTIKYCQFWGLWTIVNLSLILGAITENLQNAITENLQNAITENLQNATISVPNFGDVRGYLDQESLVFLNIRYAHAKRLEPPSLETNWRQEKPFRTFVQCPHLEPFPDGKSPEETEDCLRLHIYAPARYDSNGKRIDLSSMSLPVLFWIHGGGYIVGNGGWPYEGFDYNKRDTIFVSINYRLGVLGFYEGNWGLLDALVALEWVQLHIHHFGGDRNRVLIFGESAGGGMANWLMTSKRGRDGNLFKAVFSQSPAPIFDVTQEEITKWGDRRGWNVQKVKKMTLDEIKNQNTLPGCVDDSFWLFRHLDCGWNWHLMRNLESDGEWEDLPHQIAKQGKVSSKISYVVGTMAEEGNFFYKHPIFQDFHMLPPPKSLLEDYFKTAFGKFAEEAKSWYPIGTLDMNKVLSQLTSDVMFKREVLTMLDAMEIGGNPGYRYIFDFEAETILFNGVGAGHAMDVFTQFPGRCASLLAQLNDVTCWDIPESALQKRIKDDFNDAIFLMVQHSSPTSKFPQWKKHENGQDTTLIIDRNGFHVRHGREGPLKFVQKIFPLGEFKPIWVKEPILSKHVGIEHKILNSHYLKPLSLVIYLYGPVCVIAAIILTFFLSCTCFGLTYYCTNCSTTAKNVEKLKKS